MTARLKGCANPKATEAYCLRRGAALEPRGGVALGRTRLKVSGIGFGGYRVLDSVDRHRRSLTLALRSGVNLIDTSANYGAGASEILVGRVLAELTARGELEREAIVVVTKGGYIEGPDLQRAREREAAGDAMPEVTRASEDCRHSIHPQYLEDQIERSGERLGLQCIDLYLLHNPEIYLDSAHREGLSVDEAREEFYRRIGRAFDFLEEQVRAGRIGHYGLSCNSVGRGSGEFDYTSLKRCWEIAEGLSADHHFAAIEMPVNLFETGGWTELNQVGRSQSALEFALERGLGVLANRPLNALFYDRMIRLADPPESQVQEEAEIERRLGELKGIEAESTSDAEGGPWPIGARLDIAVAIESRWRTVPNAVKWNEFVHKRLVPATRGLDAALAEAETTSRALRDWRERYVSALNRVLGVLAEYIEAKSRPRLDSVHDVLGKVIPDELGGAPLSQKAIWIVRSMPGVSSVLVGMRREAYVADCLAAGSVPVGRLDRAKSDRWVARIHAVG